MYKDDFVCCLSGYASLDTFTESALTFNQIPSIFLVYFPIKLQKTADLYYIISYKIACPEKK